MLNVFLPHTTIIFYIFLLTKRVTENKKLNEARVIKRPPKESLSYNSIVKHKITTPSKENTDGNIYKGSTQTLAYYLVFSEVIRRSKKS